VALTAPTPAGAAVVPEGRPPLRSAAGTVTRVVTSPDDPYAIEWAEQSGHLASNARDDAGWYAAQAGALVRPTDRVAVDVGSGGGGMTLALAGALTAGRVVAVDVEPALLASTVELVAAALPDTRLRVETAVADLADGAEALRAALGEPADLIWAAASVHHLGDQQAAVSLLADLLAPGGRLALAEGGLPARHLPWDVGVGEPGLELRLDLAQDRWFAGMRAGLPGAVRMAYGWTEALRRAGLAEVTTRSTLLESPVPLGVQTRQRVVEGLAHRVDRLRPSGLLAPDDLAAWDALLDPDSPAWLGHRTDLSRLSARSVHVGVRWEAP
jgi:SAM-dependent methyltransferase